MQYYIKIEGFLNCKVAARGPILYLLMDFDKSYEIYSIYWRVFYKGRYFLIDTGIKDINYINTTVKGNNGWEMVKEIQIFDKIDYIFPTHLHYDHASGVYDYRNAKIIINKKTYENLFNLEYELIFKEKIYHSRIMENIKNKENIIVLEDGEDIIDGVKTFWVGGHTPCSQAIVFNTDFLKNSDYDKKIVFAGDVVSTFRNINEQIPGGYNYNLIDYFNFFKKYTLDRYLIIPSHDKESYTLFNNLEIFNKSGDKI